MKRRDFLKLGAKQGLAGAAALSLRSLATGLPASFLLTGALPAFAANTGKTLILGMSDDGESLNSYAPGSFATSDADPRNAIERISEAELGTASLGQINGQDITAADFSTGVDIQMGSSQVKGARIFSYLSQSLRDRLCFFHLRTGANGHPEGTNVHQMNGLLTRTDGRGQEEIQSAIAQELTAAGLVTPGYLQTPMVLYGDGGRLATLQYDAVPISRYKPSDVKNLYLGATGTVKALDNMQRVYDDTIDSIYHQLKISGTPRQKSFLDAYASSRTQAAALGDQLGDLLSDVSGDTFLDQAKSAVAMAKVNLAPVIVIRHAFSKDNHGDSDLAGEGGLTITSLQNLDTLWNLLVAEGLQDSVNFSTFDIFGRTTGRNASGGRDHHNSSCTNIMFGANIKAGTIGGYEARNHATRTVSATGIHSLTGTADNADIDADDTLSAYGRTLMASVGISEERIAARVLSGKTVTGAFV